MDEVVGVVALVVGAVAAFAASEVARELERRADRRSEAVREEPSGVSVPRGGERRAGAARGAERLYWLQCAVPEGAPCSTVLTPERETASPRSGSDA